ncbi:MAG: hypothetical protein IJZ86_04230 [Bacteroides sp.]|nr:hypothetical protein [Bacteroides sp.]
MRKIIAFILTLFTTFLYFCCESTFDLENTPKEINKESIVGVAKQLVANVKGELSLPTPSNKKAVTRGVSYPTALTPIWEKARIEWNQDEQILLVPLCSEKEIRSKVKMEKENEETYQFSRTFSRLIVRTRGDITFAHLVTYLPESNYAEEHVAELDTMGYFPKHINYQGVVLVSSLNGTLLHGLLYEDGRIISKLIANSHKHEHSEACTHEHHHGKVQLTLNLYTASSTAITRAYNDGEETIICSMCGKEDIYCECVIIDGDIIYCPDCGNPTYECTCSEKPDVCPTCGENPCSCSPTPTLACEVCENYPCICGGDNNGGGSSGSGGNNGSENNENNDGGSNNNGNTSGTAPTTYIPASNDKLANDGIPLTMTKQVANCCVSAIMEFINNQIYGKDVNQGTYDLYYMQTYGEVPSESGIKLEHIYSYVEHFFQTKTFSDYQTAIEKGYTIMSDVRGTEGIDTHAILVIGYQENGDIIYMDPNAGEAQVADDSYIVGNFNIVVSGVK